MSNLLLLLAAVNGAGCPQPKIVDWTHLPWTTQDTAAYSRAMERCRVHFGDTAPCLKTFIKKEERTYYAVCNRPGTERSAAHNGRGYWLTIIDTKTKGQQDSGFTSPDTSGQKCGTTCPNRRTNTGGGK